MWENMVIVVRLEGELELECVLKWVQWTVPQICSANLIEIVWHKFVMQVWIGRSWNVSGSNGRIPKWNKEGRAGHILESKNKSLTRSWMNFWSGRGMGECYISVTMSTQSLSLNIIIIITLIPRRYSCLSSSSSPSDYSDISPSQSPSYSKVMTTPSSLSYSEFITGISYVNSIR